MSIYEMSVANRMKPEVQIGLDQSNFLNLTFPNLPYYSLHPT